ncbi:TPA: hypothetical protein ACM3IR_004869, partial [Escherichia coli]
MAAFLPISESQPINISVIYLIFSGYRVCTPGSEQGEDINAQPDERHIIYYLQTDTAVIAILIWALLQIVGGDKLIIPF